MSLISPTPDPAKPATAPADALLSQVLAALRFPDSVHGQEADTIREDATAAAMFLHGYLLASGSNIAGDIEREIIEALRLLVSRIEPPSEHNLRVDIQRCIEEYQLRYSSDAALLQGDHQNSGIPDSFKHLAGPSAASLSEGIFSKTSQGIQADHAVVIEESSLTQPHTPVLTAVVSCPAVALSAGNVLLAAHTADALGLSLSAATNLATVGLKVAEHYTGKKLGLPFYILAAVNAATAASVVCQGAKTVGIEGLVAFQEDAMKYVLGATAFSAWSVGHGLAARNQGDSTNRKSPLGDEQTWYGIGDIAAVHGNPISTTLFVVGLARALGGAATETANAHEEEIESFGGFLKKHATPARMYGIGYILGSLLSIKRPLDASAQAAWGLGYLNFDADKNKAFIADLRSVVHSSIDWMCTEILISTLKERPNLQEVSSDDSINVAALLMKSLPAIDKLKLTRGCPSEQLWGRVSNTLEQLYPRVLSESKGDLFALLEVAACYSDAAQEVIWRLKRAGDPLAVAKGQRFTGSFLYSTRLQNPNMDAVRRAQSLYRSLGLRPS
jgi:hypothetical protein